MKKGISCLFIFLLSNILAVSGQKPEEIVIDGWYTGNLEEVLDRVSQEKGLVFSFNREYARTIRIDAPPFKRSVDSFLKNVVCHGNKLKYYIDDAQTIHIVEIWKQVDEKKVHKKVITDKAASRFNFAISGRILDNDNNESLPYVNLIVNQTKTGSSSNTDGLFTLLNIPSDTASITISYIGYKVYNLKLHPDMDLNKLEIRLEPTTELLNEVVILSDKQDLLQTNKKVGMIKMTPLKMNLLPSLGEKDIFRTFQLMPGISAANENSSGLYVRGGTPDQSLVLYDGIPIYNVQHLFGFYSAFNSNAIKDIQLYKSGFDAKYGGRLSSVVEITGKEGSTKGFGAMADISLMSANGYVEFPIGKKITFLAAGRRSWQSPLYETIFDQSTGSSQSTAGGSAPPGMSNKQKNETGYDSYFYDVNTKLTYRPTSRDVISLSFYNGADDLDNSFSPGGGRFTIQNEDKTKWGNTGAAFKWSHNWGMRLYTNLLLSYSNYYNNRDRSSQLPTAIGSSTKVTETISERNNLDDLSAKLDFEYKLTDRQQLIFGYHLSVNKTDYFLNENDTLTVLNNRSDATLNTLYLQDRFMLCDTRLELTGGVRASHYSPTNKIYAEPRFTGTYQIDNRWKLKGSAGYYYQFAKKITREDIMQGNRDFWLMADGDLMPVGRSLQGVLGAAYETNGYLFDVEGYYKKLYDISEYSIRTTNMSGQGGDNGAPMPRMASAGSASSIYSDRFYSGDGYARGVDFLIQKKHGDYTGWVSYTIGQVIHNFPEISSSKYYASNDVTHEFKIVNIYKWRNWNFSANWLLATGKPYTAPEGLYQITLPDGSQKTYFTPSAKNGKRLPTYHRLDVAATYSFKISERFPCSVNLSLFNLYNRSNVWYKEFQAVDNEVVETDVNYLGITPNINFSIKF
ncbi:MAG: carboxypeptidase-like regulatory domain-containing protein [Bacteroidales bacterium]